MSSLGTVAVAWIVVLSIMPATLFIFSTLAAISAVSNEVIQEIREEINIKAIEITDASPITDKVIRIRILNKGQVGYKVSYFTHADLIVSYHQPGNNSVRSAWLPYDPTGLNEEGWRIDGVRHDVVDPVDTDTGLKGVWNTGEEITIVAWVSKPINTTMPIHVRFTPPIGVGEQYDDE